MPASSFCTHRCPCHSFRPSSAHDLLLGLTSAKTEFNSPSSGNLSRSRPSSSDHPFPDVLSLRVDSSFVCTLSRPSQHRLGPWMCGDGEEAADWHLLRASSLRAPCCLLQASAAPPPSIFIHRPAPSACIYSSTHSVPLSEAAGNKVRGRCSQGFSLGAEQPGVGDGV